MDGIKKMHDYLHLRRDRKGKGEDTCKLGSREMCLEMFYHVYLLM